MSSKESEIMYAINYEQEMIDKCARELRHHERVRDLLKEMQHAL
jgi:hypothetical protein